MRAGSGFPAIAEPLADQDYVPHGYAPRGEQMTTGLALADAARIALIGIGVGDDRTSVVWDVPFSAGWKLQPKPNHVGAQ